jgi:hypothetical protein
MAVTHVEHKPHASEFQNVQKCCEKGTTMCILLVVCYLLIGLTLFMVWQKLT